MSSFRFWAAAEAPDHLIGRLVGAQSAQTGVPQPAGFGELAVGDFPTSDGLTQCASRASSRGTSTNGEVFRLSFSSNAWMSSS